MLNYKLGERKSRRKKGLEDKGEEGVSSGEIGENNNKEKEGGTIFFMNCLKDLCITVCITYCKRMKYV